MIPSETVFVSPAVGVLLLIGFVLVFSNVFYRATRKYYYHFKLGKHLYPNQVDGYFLLSSGWYSDFDLLTLLWFYSPVYFQKVDESLFDEKANNLVRQVKYASNNFIKALLVYVCYIALFWLIPGS